MAEPLLLPLQVTDVDVALIVKSGGSKMLTVMDELQPVLSVTVAVYDPEHKFMIVLVVSPLLQRMVYGVLPPVAPTVIWPVQMPLQVRDVEEIILVVTPFRLFTVIEPVVVHPLLSVTVTE